MPYLTSPQQLYPPSVAGAPQDSSNASNAEPDDSDVDSDTDEGDRLQALNSTHQELFAAEMQDLAQKRGHSRVGVLLIQWEPEDESYLDTREEVKRLRAVLEDEYQFSVRERYLHTRKSAPHQLNCHLADFVRDEDDKNALLIVYYAGHGRDGKGKLFLEGGNSKKGKHISRILWTEVEHQLERAEADLLVIFDCCYAGLLANDKRRSAAPRKIFEYLGATLHNKPAWGPGDNSFTSALIWALQRLAQGPDGFTTSQLLAEIRIAPNFDTDQQPQWSPRGKDPSLYRLKISPLHGRTESNASLNNTSSTDTTSAEDPSQFYLQLQFSFEKAPTRDHIVSLADGLKDVVQLRDVPIKQVRWKGLSDANVKLDFRGAALMSLWEAKLRRRKHSSISNSPAIGNDEVNEIMVPAVPAVPANAVDKLQITTTATTFIEDRHAPRQLGPETPNRVEVDRIQTLVVMASSSRHSSYVLSFLGGCFAAFCVFVAWIMLRPGTNFAKYSL